MHMCHHQMIFLVSARLQRHLSIWLLFEGHVYFGSSKEIRGRNCKYMICIGGGKNVYG